MIKQSHGECSVSSIRVSNSQCQLLEQVRMVHGVQGVLLSYSQLNKLLLGNQSQELSQDKPKMNYFFVHTLSLSLSLFLLSYISHNSKLFKKMNWITFILEQRHGLLGNPGPWQLCWFIFKALLSTYTLFQTQPNIAMPLPHHNATGTPPPTERCSSPNTLKEWLLEPVKEAKALTRLLNSLDPNPIKHP